MNGNFPTVEITVCEKKWYQKKSHAENYSSRKKIQQIRFMLAINCSREEQCASVHFSKMKDILVVLQK